MKRFMLGLTGPCALVVFATCGCSDAQGRAPGTGEPGPAAAPMDEPSDETSIVGGLILPPGMTALGGKIVGPVTAPATWREDVSTHIATGEYAIRAGTSGLAAYNRAHRMDVHWEAGGVRVSASEQDPLVMRTKDVARGDARVAAARADFAAGACQRDGARDEMDHCLRRAESTQSRWLEWWENRRDGLEQGFELAEAPLGQADGAPLRIEIAVEGARIEVDADGRSATLFTAAGSFRYAGLSARDAKGRDLPARIVASDGGLALQIDDAGAMYPVTVDPVLSASTWKPEGDVADASFGFRVASAGDVNGDGYGDILVGAYGYTNGEAAEGKVFLYRGSASGPETTPFWHHESNQVNALMGEVASAGDVNRDGLADIIVGAWLWDGGNTDEGRVEVFYGRTGTIPDVPDWFKEGDQNNAFFGYSVASAGDMNCDTWGDIVIGAPRYTNGQTEEGKVFVYFGGQGGLGSTPGYTRELDQAKAYLGLSVDGAGDTNFDGCSDIVMGAPNYDSNNLTDNGRVLLTTGAFSGVGTVWGFDGTMAGGSFGYSVAGVGDVNGDVQSDFIVGAPAESNGQTAEGRAYVYRGIAGTSRPTVISTTESNQANANYGFSVAGAGDLNGDGYADVLVGAPNYDGSKIDEGRVFGYFGDGTATPLKNSFFKEAGQAGASFGISVSSAGDTDGDGRSEMLVGASQYDNGQNNEGAVFHYRGTSGWYQTTPAVTFTGGVQGDQLGLSVATADVNGDGYADLVIGEPQYDNGETNEGRVLVYLGGTVGPSAGATPWSVESNRAGARLGATVANAGDVNGDGFADIVVGAPNYANPEVNEGAVFVYFGGTAGFQSTSWVQEGNAAGLYLGISVAGAGDVNGDGYADLIAGAPGYSNGQSSEGGAFLYLGNSSFTPTQSAWAGQSNQSQSDYGLSVSSAGDVNGDGKGDVIVGARRYDNGQTDEGMAFVYLGGGPNGLQDTPVLLESNVAGSQFATSVAGGFDTGTDGFGDVIVGAPLYSMGQTNEGAVYVYRGSATGIVTMPAKVYESNAANDSWGTMVASAGDFNADGRGDVLIQSPTHGTTGYVSPCFGTGKNAGQGDPLDCSSPRLNATWTTGLIGRSGAAGDVNGDGFSDLIVGTPDYSTGTATVGRVDFYFANAQDSNLRGVALALQARRPNLTVAIPAHGRSASTTGFDATVIRPRNPWGYGRVKIQVEAKPLGTPFDGAGLMTSNWFTSGRENAAKLLIGPGVAGNTPHWRARLVYDQVQSPIFQRSRWLYGGQLGEAGAAEVRIMP